MCTIQTRVDPEAQLCIQKKRSPVVTSGLQRKVQCIPQKMHELQPFPIPDHHKVLQTRFFAWCEVGACRARCYALSLALAPGPSQRGNWQGGRHPSEPAQAPWKGHRTSPKPPDTNHDRLVQSCTRRQFVSVRLSGNPSRCCGPCHKSVVEKSRHQQTCNHASKQAPHQKNSTKV
jgi:hypothetical protein